MNFNIKKIATYHGHRGSIYDITAGLHEDTFLSASGDGYIVEWFDPERGIPLAKVNHSVYSIEHLKEKNRLWIGENFEGIHLIDTALKKDIAFLKLGKAAIFSIKSYRNDTFVGDRAGVIHVVDQETLQVKHQIKTTDRSARAMAIQPDNRELAVGFSDHKIRIFDLDSFSLKYEINAHKNSVFTLAYHDQTLISSGRDAYIKTWDSQNEYRQTGQVPAHNYAINHILPLEGTSLMASCSMDKSIKLWNIDDLELLKVINNRKFPSHGTSINKLWWDVKREKLFSVSDDRTISEWNLF